MAINLNFHARYTLAHKFMKTKKISELKTTITEPFMAKQLLF